MKRRWLVSLLLGIAWTTWCGLVTSAHAQERAGQRAGEQPGEHEPIVTEIGARFAVGATTLRPSDDDRAFSIAAHSEPGYSLGFYATLLHLGWLRLQTEFLFTSKQTTLAETRGVLMSTYSFTYLDLPVLARVDVPLPSRVHPFVAFGVSPGILVDAVHGDGIDLEGVLHTFDFSLVGAAGARIRLNASWDLTIELRGMYGLADVFVRTPRKSSALFFAMGLGHQRVPRRDGSRTPDAESINTLSWRARRTPARDDTRASPRGVDRTSLRQRDPAAELSYGFAYVPEHSTDERCIEQRDPRTPAQSSVSTSCLPGGTEPGNQASTASATDLAMIPAGVAMSPAVAWSCSGAPEPAQLVAGDVIDHIVIAERSRTLHVHMTSGHVYCYPLRSDARIPQGGTYQGSKSGLTLTIMLDGSRYMTLKLAGLPAPILEAWRRIQAGALFRVDVLANHVASSKLGQELEAKGISKKTAERMASKLADDGRFTVADARSLATALGKSMKASEDPTWFLPFDDKDWQAWMRGYGGKPGAFGPVQDRQSARAVEKLLTSRKHTQGLEDPPTVTARQFAQQVQQDPEQIAAWNALAPWERTLWKDYWKHYPASTQGSDNELSLTEDARFRMALSISPEYMPEGFRDAADALYHDPLFMGTCLASISLYVVAVLNPEPLFSKVTAAVITAGLLTVFSFSEIYHLAMAWFRLREQSARARTLAELQAAARNFGKSIGGTGLRVILALASLFIGKALPTLKAGPTTTPTASAVVTSAGAVSKAMVRTLTIEGIRVVILADGTIGLPILASVTAGGTGGTDGTGTSAGQGRPTESNSPTRDDVVKSEAGNTRVSGEALKAARREFNRIKSTFWKHQAKTNPGAWSTDNLARMRQGKAPLGTDGHPMELHHRKPLAEGGTNDFDNLVPMSRTEHRLGPNYKRNHQNIP